MFFSIWLNETLTLIVLQQCKLIMRFLLFTFELDLEARSFFHKSCNVQYSSCQFNNWTRCLSRAISSNASSQSSFLLYILHQLHQFELYEMFAESNFIDRIISTKLFIAHSTSVTSVRIVRDVCWKQFHRSHHLVELFISHFTSTTSIRIVRNAWWKKLHTKQHLKLKII